LGDYYSEEQYMDDKCTDMSCHKLSAVSSIKRVKKQVTNIQPRPSCFSWFIRTGKNQSSKEKGKNDKKKKGKV